MNNPLKDILVLDLTRVLAGPFATMILADLGARVVKVERPDGGDDSRAFGPFVKGKSAYFMSLNRGKESVALDLKHPRGKEIFLSLTQKADVVVENFRPGTMEKLGLGYETLRTVNPRLIYAAASGFGHTGPQAGRAAYDMIVQGESGMMSITGQPGGPPTRVGASIGDITAGLFCAIGIMTALYMREKTGQGQKVDVAMLDSQVAILENAIARTVISGKAPGPLGSRHPSITPFEAFKTADGHIIVAIGNDALWQKFCRTVGKGELAAVDDFATNASRTDNYDKLKPILDEIFAGRTTGEWMDILEKAGIPNGPINTIDKVLVHPQVLARNMIVRAKDPEIGEIPMAGNPIKMTAVEDPSTRRPAPNLGEHTHRVLHDLLGLTPTEMEALRRTGALG